MNQTAATDADRGRSAAAPAHLQAAADDIGRIGSRRDVEQNPGDDEEPEIVDAEYRPSPATRQHFQAAITRTRSLIQVKYESPSDIVGFHGRHTAFFLRRPDIGRTHKSDKARCRSRRRPAAFAEMHVLAANVTRLP